MGVKGSGELRFPDHNNESTGQDITEEFGPDGSGEVKLKDYYRGGTKVPNITENNNVPDGTSGNTEISLKDFYNAADLSFDGNLAGTTGNFSFGTSTLIPAANGIFDMNSSGTATNTHAWEMLNRSEVANPPPAFPSSNSAALSTATIHVGNDKTNKRILLLFLKDGTQSVNAGGLNGAKASYRVLPYVGLENATWTAKIEYNSNDNGYDSTNGTIGTYNGEIDPPSDMSLTYSTSSSFHTLPTADTFLSVPGFTGMAADGDSLTQDGSSRSFIWTAKVAGNLTNRASSTGAGSVAGGLGSTGCRITIKAVSGSDTFQTVSDYWDIGLAAQKGGLF